MPSLPASNKHATERQNGLTGLGNAFRTIASLLLIVRPARLGVALTEDITGSLAMWEPNLYLYDSYSGGIGLSAPLYRLSDRLFHQTAELIEAVPAKPAAPPALDRLEKSAIREKGWLRKFLARLLVRNQAVSNETSV